MARVFGLVLGFFVFAVSAQAGGPDMAVGAVDAPARDLDYAFAKAELDKAKLAGLDTIRLTQAWTRGQKAIGAADADELANAVRAAQFTGVRVVLSVAPRTASATPVSDADRINFALFCASVAKRFPFLHDFVVGIEPNVDRFWLPQLGPSGEDVAASTYVSLLAAAYDALKAARPQATVYGGALAGRGTVSPQAFVADMGAAYRASGRARPLMDVFALRPLDTTAPTVDGTTLGIADYPTLVSLLGQAFDGTAQPGSTLPLLYDAVGVETSVPRAKARAYRGKEPTTPNPADVAIQARAYQQALTTVFCQPNVVGLVLLRVQDDRGLAGSQAGEFYADGSPKPSMYAVRDTASAVRRGVAARCEGMQLTPKVVIRTGTPDRKGLKVFLTCSLDCSYSVTLDGRRTLRGAAIGRVPTTILFAGAVARGEHAVTASAVATVNAGPPTTATREFVSR